MFAAGKDSQADAKSILSFIVTMVLNGPRVAVNTLLCDKRCRVAWVDGLQFGCDVTGNAGSGVAQSGNKGQRHKRDCGGQNHKIQRDCALFIANERLGGCFRE